MIDNVWWRCLLMFSLCVRRPFILKYLLRWATWIREELPVREWLQSHLGLAFAESKAPRRDLLRPSPGWSLHSSKASRLDKIEAPADSHRVIFCELHLLVIM